MFLQLGYRHYDSLEQLQQALDELALHHAFRAYDAQACNQENSKHPTPEQVKELLIIARGILDAVRMLGRIKLSILEDNPAVGHVPREMWTSCLHSSQGTNAPAPIG